MLFKLMLLPFALLFYSKPIDHWKADTEKSKVEFNVSGPFGKVDGSFSGLKADIQFSEKDLGNSSITASIDATTISTGVGMRNRDLKNESKWFDTDKYPRISFKSTKIEKSGNGYKAIGQLTMKSVTKQIEIPFTFNPSNDAGVFKGTFEVKRADYTVGKSGGSVGSTVTVHLEIPVKKG